MTITIKLNPYDSPTKAKMTISDDATLTEAVDCFTSVLHSAGYMFKELSVVDYEPLGNIEGWKLGDTYLGEGAVYPETHINDLKEHWTSRISVCGYEGDDSKQLAERIVYLLNTYGA